MVRPRQIQIEPLSGNTEGPGDSNEVISLTGDNGVIDSGGSRFTNTTGNVLIEQSTVPGGNPSSGHGTLWVRNDSPNVLVFTNDAGSDTVINGITSHSDLSNLSNDDHTQYLLVNGSRAMSGSLNMGSNAIGGVTTLSTSGNIISLGGVSATSNTLSHHASVPGGLPGAEAGKLWVKNNVPNVLMFTDNSGADHQLAYTDHVAPQNISEILSFGNDTDGYDIDLTNGSVITSSDGYVVIDNDAIIDGMLVAGVYSLLGDGYSSSRWEYDNIDDVFTIKSIDKDLQVNGFIFPETFSDTLALPSEDGLNGHVLQTDGVGNLFFGPIDGYASSNIGIDTVLSNNSDANGQEIANLSNLGLVTNSNEDLALTLTSGGVNGGTTSIRVGTSSPHNVITPEHVGQLYFQTEQGTAGLWQSLSTASSGWRRYLFDFGIGGENQVLISGGSARVNSFPAMTYDSTLQQLQIRGSESQGTTGYSLRDNLGNEDGGLQYDQSNSLITLFSETDGYIVGDWEVPVGSTLSAQPPIDSNHVVIKDYLDENTGNYLVVDAQGEITITVNAALYGNRSPDKTHLFINCRGNGTKTIVLSSETIMLGQIITVSKTWASSSIIIEPPAGVLFERTTGIRTIVGLTEGNRSFTFAYLSPINGYSIINSPRFGISANSVLGNTSSSNELPNGISYNTNSLLLRGSGNLAVTDVPDGYLIGRPTGGELGSHSLSDFDIVTIQNTFHGGSSNISWNDSTRKVELKGDNFITSGYVLQTSDNQYRGSFQYNQTNNELSISASSELNAAYIYGDWEVPVGSTLSAQEPTEDGHVVTKEYLETYVQHGTYTPSTSNIENMTINTIVGYYMKIGNMCSVNIIITMTNTESSTPKRLDASLPFDPIGGAFNVTAIIGSGFSAPISTASTSISNALVWSLDTNNLVRITNMDTDSESSRRFNVHFMYNCE